MALEQAVLEFLEVAYRLQTLIDSRRPGRALEKEDTT